MLIKPHKAFNVKHARIAICRSVGSVQLKSRIVNTIFEKTITNIEQNVKHVDWNINASYGLRIL
jgi:hypothetical protein